MATSQELYNHLFLSKVDFLYDHNEINHLLLQLMVTSDNTPLYQLVCRVFAETQIFLAATTVDPTFMQKRESKRQHKLYVEVFDRIGTVLTIAEVRLKGLSKESDDAVFLNSVINYCYKTILRRLLLLKNVNDIFYTQHWLTSNLHRLILTRKQKSDREEHD